MNLRLEHTLSSKLKKGDREAFRDIFSSYHGPLCVFALKYIHDRQDVKDIVQETFVSLWECRSRFSSDNHLKSFLYLSVKNKCLNRLKHNRVKDEYAFRIAEEGDDKFFEEQVVETEVLTLLRQAISQLPEKRREVILKSLQGMRNEDIAASMSISVNTVKLQKKHAYTFLRKQLKEVFIIIFL